MRAPEPAKIQPQVSLIWALPEHAEAIAQLHGSLFNPGWDAASVERTLANPGSIALLAGKSIPLEISGFALAQVAADEAEILSLGVTPDRQRQGIGARLLDGVKRAALKAGAQRLFLEVAASNRAAIELYAKAGFTQTGQRKGYYAATGGPAEDALTFTAALS